MAFKAVLVCASALLVQSISGLCANRISVPSCGCSSGNILTTGNILPSANTYSSGNVYSSSLGSSSVVSNYGGDFIVKSIGPITPAGIATATELDLAADMAIAGTMPFLAGMGFEGRLPTSGSGSVAYGCGDSGNIAITQEIGNPGGSNAAAASGLGLSNLASGSCGCGRRI